MRRTSASILFVEADCVVKGDGTSTSIQGMEAYIGFDPALVNVVDLGNTALRQTSGGVTNGSGAAAAVNLLG